MTGSEIVDEKTTEFNGVRYPSESGSPFDRGSSDSHYHRTKSPHYYPNSTGNNPRIEPPEMTDTDVKAYVQGYAWNEQYGSKKEW